MPPVLFTGTVNGASRSLVAAGDKGGNFWVLDAGTGAVVHHLAVSTQKGQNTEPSRAGTSPARTPTAASSSTAAATCPRRTPSTCPASTSAGSGSRRDRDVRARSVLSGRFVPGALRPQHRLHERGRHRHRQVHVAQAPGVPADRRRALDVAGHRVHRRRERRLHGIRREDGQRAVALPDRDDDPSAGRTPTWSTANGTSSSRRVRPASTSPTRASTKAHRRSKAATSTRRRRSSLRSLSRDSTEVLDAHARAGSGRRFRSGRRGRRRGGAGRSRRRARRAGRRARGGRRRSCASRTAMRSATARTCAPRTAR